MDLYDLGLPNQWIDVTGIPDGRYWVEAEVDPERRLLEADDVNNVSRIEVALGRPPRAVADALEENDSIEQVAAREEGGSESPNLGIVRLRAVLEALSMEDAGDFFAFRLDRAVGPGAFVRIESPYLESDLDLALLDAGGRILGVSVSGGNFEQVTLDGLADGLFYAWIIPYAGQNPDYRLIVDTGRNDPPSLELLQPGAEPLWVEQGFETLLVEWIASDPAGEPTTVSLFIDRDRTLDKQTLPLGGYQDLPGTDGIAYVNTVPLDPGEWFLYAEVTDGASVSGSWASAPFNIYVKGDVDLDGEVDLVDWITVVRVLRRHRLAPGWQQILDMDRDGDIDRADLKRLLRTALENEHGRVWRKEHDND
jgi:hypothetical protein